MNYPTDAEVAALLALSGIAVPEGVAYGSEVAAAISRAEALTGWFPLMALGVTTRRYDPVACGLYGGYGLVDVPNTIGYPVYTGGIFPTGHARGGMGYPLDLLSRCRTVVAVRAGGTVLPATWRLDRMGRVLRFSSPPFGGSAASPAPGLPDLIEVDADFGGYAVGELPASVWDAIRKLAAASVVGALREGRFAGGLIGFEEGGVKESYGFEMTRSLGAGWSTEAEAALMSPMVARVSL